MAAHMDDSKADTSSMSVDADDGSSTESEISDEPVEPKLKYERIGNDLSNILSKDAASCMAVHPKFLALGTHWGVIHVLDHLGNNIMSKEKPAHTTTVNQIAIDASGEYLASCSDDGRVVISGLYSTDNNQVHMFDRPVKAVSLDPNFGKAGSGKHYMTGDDKLVLHEKAFLNRHKTTVIHQGEGPVRNIKWSPDGQFIAWANDVGVKVYDMALKRKITSIPREDKSNLRPELYRCTLFWKNEKVLLIGWGDCVKICAVRERKEFSNPEQPSKYVEITEMFATDFYVCGLAPFGENLAVLTYVNPDENVGVPLASERPQLRIVAPHMDYYEELSNDALSIRGFTEYRCNDYHLECVIEDELFFIVSPKDVVVAKPRDDDDHVQWLMEHEFFEDAMACATRNDGRGLKRHNVQDIGRAYLNYLLEGEQLDEAARLCVKILGKNKQRWEEEVYKFARIHQLKAIAPYLPRGDVRLDPAIYEMVLNEFLHSDYEGFYQLIKEWSSTLYHIPTVINVVVDRLCAEPDNPTLLRSLGELYTREGSYDRALAIYLRLKHKDVFELIHKHGLFNSISDKIEMLVDFDTERAVRLLLDNMDQTPIDMVVKQLERRPDLQHVYLDKLFQKDPHAGQQYHGLQVSLYAQYNPEKLLSFLKSSSYYPLQRALEECQKRKFIPETVFLLGRIGNTKEALSLITQQLRDVDRAIEFCKEHDDRELWEDLITQSLDKPDFITVLLHNIGTHVDPIMLIQRIRPGLHIPHLRDSLVKIMQDYNLQIALREGCKRILVKDSFQLLHRLVKARSRGVRVDEQICQSCHNRLIVNDIRFASSVIVFHCSHAFHEDCLAVGAMSCTICHTQSKRAPGSSSGLFSP